MHRARRPLATSAVLLAALGLLSACVPPPTGDGLELVETVTGFDRPWDVAVAEDGTTLVTERSGTVAAVVDGSRQVVDTIDDVVAKGEGGLMGLAVDPDFPTNRHIYTCYAAGAGTVVEDVRVVRHTVAGDLGSLSDPTVVVDGIPAGAGNRHLGCRVGVGADGALWITTGDAVIPTAPQDPTSRAGKVLRATLTGDPAPGNPGGALDPYVYTLGHRNPQGLAFRPSDGAAFSVEHGTGCDDEVNLLTAGANFGWDPVAGDGSYDEDAPMTSPSVPGAVPAVWSTGCPTIAPSGATFLEGAEWGRWDDQLVMAVLKDQRLRFLRLDGTTVEGVDDRFSSAGRLRDVARAADGTLWVAQDSPAASLYRLAPR